MYAVRGLATLVGGIRSFIHSRAPLSFLRPFRVPPPPEIDGKTRSFPFLALRFRLRTPRDGHGETDGEEELLWVEEWGRMCLSPSPWFSLLKTPNFPSSPSHNGWEKASSNSPFFASPFHSQVLFIRPPAVLPIIHFSSAKGKRVHVNADPPGSCSTCIVFVENGFGIF